MSQSVESEVELNFCRGIGAAVVRRFTGGGTVFQDKGNLNFAFSVRNDHPLFPNSILRSYEIVAEGVMEGLRLLGIEARYSRDEMQLGGKKISGLAGANEFGTVFRHGTLLVSAEPDMIHRTLRKIKREVTNLNISSGKSIIPIEVKRALLKGFEKKYEIELGAGDLTRSERTLANLLWQKKYSNERWNLSGEHSTLILDPSDLQPISHFRAFPLSS